MLSTIPSPEAYLCVIDETLNSLPSGQVYQRRLAPLFAKTIAKDRQIECWTTHVHLTLSILKYILRTAQKSLAVRQKWVADECTISQKTYARNHEPAGQTVKSSERTDQYIPICLRVYDSPRFCSDLSSPDRAALVVSPQQRQRQEMGVYYCRLLDTLGGIGKDIREKRLLS